MEKRIKEDAELLNKNLVETSYKIYEDVDNIQYLNIGNDNKKVWIDENYKPIDRNDIRARESYLVKLENGKSFAFPIDKLDFDYTYKGEDRKSFFVRVKDEKSEYGTNVRNVAYNEEIGQNITDEEYKRELQWDKRYGTSADKIERDQKNEANSQRALEESNSGLSSADLAMLAEIKGYDIKAAKTDSGVLGSTIPDKNLILVSKDTAKIGAADKNIQSVIGHELGHAADVAENILVEYTKQGGKNTDFYRIAALTEKDVKTYGAYLADNYGDDAKLIGREIVADAISVYATNADIVRRTEPAIYEFFKNSDNDIIKAVNKTLDKTPQERAQSLWEYLTTKQAEANIEVQERLKEPEESKKQLARILVTQNLDKNFGVRRLLKNATKEEKEG